MEVGCGDAALAFAAARDVRTVYGVDVTDTLNRYCYSATEFCILAYKWNRNPLEAEWLISFTQTSCWNICTPKDAADQPQEIHRVLQPGGRYVCITTRHFLFQL
jgi:SAM-dependent methyltransferase